MSEDKKDKAPDVKRADEIPEDKEESKDYPYDLGKVTPKAIKTYQKYGLGKSGDEEAEGKNLIFEVFPDTEAVEELAKVTFADDFEDKTDDDWNEFDLVALDRGIRDFLGQFYTG